ncbi:hypothetical protein [Streptomyces sp. NBC_01198]|nr:hypothetical protein OG702_08660 [Streptomyces sp. NBC_01198]
MFTPVRIKVTSRPMRARLRLRAGALKKLKMVTQVLFGVAVTGAWT